MDNAFDTIFYCILDKQKKIKQISPSFVSFLNMGKIQNKDIIDSDISYYLPEVNLFSFNQNFEFRNLENVNQTNLTLELYKIDLLNSNNLRYLLILKDHSYEKSLLEQFNQLSQDIDLMIKAFNSLPDGIHVTDDTGIVIFVNDQYLNITGLKREEVINKSIHETIRSMVPSIVSRSITDVVLMRKHPVSLITEYSRTKRTCLVTGTPVISKNKITRVISTIRDITEINLLKDKLATMDSLNHTYQYKLKEIEVKISSDNTSNLCSKAMEDLYDKAMKVVSVDIPLLLLGETGVGKDFFAKFIHDNSNRNKGHFISLNCSAIPEQLIESELFGYDTGAFSGASKKGKAGLFEIANDGTLYLDEIGDMPINLQVKLLSAIQNKKIYRLGSTKSIDINARIIAATNVNLDEQIQIGKFRSDLYYRINAIEFKIPPLRDRKEDILPLANKFLKEFNQKYEKSCYFASETIRFLYNYNWPGNIRELKNTIEKMIILTDEDQIKPNVFQTYRTDDFNIINMPYNSKMTLKQAVEEYEAFVIKEAIKKHGNLTLAAKSLGIDYSTLMRKKLKYK